MLIISIIIYKIKPNNTNLKKLAGKIIPACLIILFITGFTNLSYWLTFPIEGRFDSYRNIINAGPYSGIIVLAGSERTIVSTLTKQTTVDNGAERLIATAKLARLFPNLPIIHSGRGRKDEQYWSENDVAQRFFEDVGTDIKRIKFDRKSYNTHSNALETFKLITPDEKNKWFLVTSAFHMPRSVAAYRKAGVNIQPYPVDYRTTLKYDGIFSFNFSKNLSHFDLVIHEYVGLLAYYITGRSSSLFPEA